MKKKLFSLNFKQVLIIVTPLAVVALFVIIAFSQLIGLIINESIKSSMGFVCEKVEYETRTSLEKGDYSDSELFNFINELDLTANTNANIIDKSGNYITRHNPKIARSENYFADSALKKYTSAEYLDGEAKSFVTSKHFFAVRKIGNSDFFVIIEGPMADYTNQLAGVFNIILIITIILIFGCLLFFAFIINRTNAKEKDISDKLIETMGRHENICRSIHLPVQSGSDAMLVKMRRRYTRAWYLDRVAKIRSVMPDCAISTDIIAGFCGETEQDHQDTLSIMREVGYDAAFMFQYSERPGTYAHKHLPDNIPGTLAARNYPDDVPPEVKTRRLNEIIALQNELSLESNRRDVGKVFRILVEGPSKRNAAELCGRNSAGKMCVFPDTEHRAGDYLDVRVLSCTSATLICQLA